MNLPLEFSMPEQMKALRRNLATGSAAIANTRRTRTILCGLLAFTWPFAAAFAQSSSSQPSSSSSQQPPAPAQTSSQAQPAAPDQPQKQDSLAEAARKAKEKKPAAAKGKVFTEDDLSKLKGPGVSVVGDAPKKGARRTQPTDEDGGESAEQDWRGRAQQFLSAIAQTDEQIAQKKEEIRKFGGGGFDVTTGRNDNIAYINDRNAQLKQLEAHKADLEKQFEELQDEGRKAGVPSSWFR
jgi:hypothetical protein